MYLFYVLILAVLLSGCEGAFAPSHELHPDFSSLQEGALSADIEAQRKLGQKLYAKNCASCHGGIEASTKLRRSAQQIKVAIQGSANQDYPPIQQMQSASYLAGLKDKELSYIAVALGGRPFADENGVGLATCESQAKPGRVTAHRLNRAEYTNSINDLFGINSNVGGRLPADGYAGNFNNNADVLTVTSHSIEKYLEASDAAIEQALTTNARGLLGCELAQLNKSCAESAALRLAEKAFRRPLNSADKTKVLNIIENGIENSLSYRDSVKLALQWVVSSPNFLFRIISHSEPNNADSVTELNGYELATRLSYFIWSSTPDDRLMSLARSGKIREAKTIEDEVDRMLADDRSQALVDNFAMQWIESHRLEMAAPNTNLYSFNESTRADMLMESKLFFDEIFAKDLSLLRVLDADFTFVNQRLAQHYNMSGPQSNTNFQKVSLAGTGRKGVLTQGGVLTHTSYEGRTSIVLRGKFVLDNILCDSPAPPPPEAEGIIEEAVTEGNLREQMQAHRANPVCASCHSSMDPMGFSLEGFNAVGQGRTEYPGGSVIDTSGSLPSGSKFDGIGQLTQILKVDPAYKVCVSKKLMTYALGRTLTEEDECTVNRLALEKVGESYGISDLIKGIVISDPFQKQQGDGGR